MACSDSVLGGSADPISSSDDDGTFGDDFDAQWCTDDVCVEELFGYGCSHAEDSPRCETVDQDVVNHEDALSKAPPFPPGSAEVAAEQPDTWDLSSDEDEAPCSDGAICSGAPELTSQENGRDKLLVGGGSKPRAQAPPNKSQNQNPFPLLRNYC